MTTLELEQVTRELLRDIYKAEYTGKLEVYKLDPIGYEVCLGILTPDLPKVIYGLLDDDAFVKYLEKELRICRFNLVNFGTLRLDIQHSCLPVDSKCGCNN